MKHIEYKYRERAWARVNSLDVRARARNPKTKPSPPGVILLF